MHVKERDASTVDKPVAAHERSVATLNCDDVMKGLSRTIGEEKTTAIGEETTAIGDEKTTAIGEEKTTAIGDEKTTAIGEGEDNCNR